MIYPNNKQNGDLSHTLVVDPAPKKEHLDLFVSQFATYLSAWFLRTTIRKSDGTGRIFFRVENTRAGDETLRYILDLARVTYRNAAVYVRPLHAGAKVETDLQH